jgi:hypothetical protein
LIVIPEQAGMTARDNQVLTTQYSFLSDAQNQAVRLFFHVISKSLFVFVFDFGVFPA